MHLLSVENNIKKILQTKKQSLPLNPWAGVSNKYIDKNLSQKELLECKDEIFSLIAKFEPRIKPSDIQLINTGEEIVIEIKETKIIIS